MHRVPNIAQVLQSSRNGCNRLITEHLCNRDHMFKYRTTQLALEQKKPSVLSVMDPLLAGSYDFPAFKFPQQPFHVA